jgi:hypothetical protein
MYRYCSNRCTFISKTRELPTFPFADVQIGVHVYANLGMHAPTYV